MSRQIDTGTLRDWLDEGRPVVVLDVRDADARAQWAIPGSVHLDAYDDLRAGRPGALATADLPSDRPVVTVCNAGRISLTAADVLEQRGLDAWSLSGGMKAWSLAWNEAEVAVATPGVRVVQLRRTGKGCLSYVIGSAGDATVIDASLDPAVYLEVLGREGWTLRSVLETHVHADHVSRAKVLADETGAALLLPVQKRVHFPFTPVRDGDTIAVGSARLVARRTPGHTDESTTYLLGDAGAFTGDTLFVRGVGRPDLHADSAEATRRARDLFASLQTLRALPADTLVLPAHTSEAVPFDHRPVVARIRDIDTWLSDWMTSEPTFIERLLARVPPTPPNFSTIVSLNEAGEQPTGDPTDLEAGANRCAIA